MIDFISTLIVPLIVVLTGLVIFISRRDMFDIFIEGARSGLETGVRLLPTLVLLLTAVSMFNASGAADYISSFCAPLCSKLGIPSELMPYITIRPISGGASTAMINELFDKYGADSFTGRCASVIMGSSDTLIYIIAVYFSATTVKHTRHALPSAVLTMIFCIFFSCFITRVFFSC